MLKTCKDDTHTHTHTYTHTHACSANIENSLYSVLNNLTQITFCFLTKLFFRKFKYIYFLIKKNIYLKPHNGLLCNQITMKLEACGIVMQGSECQHVERATFLFFLSLRFTSSTHLYIERVDYISYNE